jgi:hypothetical protein
MVTPENTTLERVQYWQGQKLRSKDFTNLQRVEAQRRWWHNRALHNAYGIAEGMACSLTPAAAPTGVSVGIGIAYDLFGRELILERPLIILLPANLPQGFLGSISLVMRYKSASNATTAGCWNSSASVSSGTVEFVWMPGLMGVGLNPSIGVAIIALKYDGKGLTGPYPGYAPLVTQPMAGPLLGSGSTIPGGTPWEPWTAGYVYGLSGDLVPNIIGVQTWVDTSAAGFTRIPCYFATLQGPQWSPKTAQLVPAVFPSLDGESIVGFTFRLFLQVVPFQREGSVELESYVAPSFRYVTWPSDFLLYAQQRNLCVSWIGCQMPASTSSCCVSAPSASLGSASLASTSPLLSR